MVGARALAKLRRAPVASWMQVLVHVVALTPLARLILDGLRNDLTINPIQEITTRTGLTALVLLVSSLACTPASSVFGFRMAIKWRRPLGLYAFLYASLHFLTFTVLDYGLNWGLLREAILEKRYALVGFSAFLLLIPLAITSTRGWMRRLGKRWKKLHRLVYPAALLVVVHYVWLVKSDIRLPLLFGAVVVTLLALRTRYVKDLIQRAKAAKRRRSRPPADLVSAALPATGDGSLSGQGPIR
jgi:sulfoxide reductase heme-binding subunit YedZ